MQHPNQKVQLFAGHYTRQLSEKAWKLKNGQHDITSTRILFIRLATAFHDGKSAHPYVGLLKSLLTGPTLEVHGNVTTTWNVDSLIEFLASRLSPADVKFLTALAAALNERSKVAELDGFVQWSDQPALSLEGSTIDQG